MDGKDALFGEHPGMGVMDFQQRIEEILLGIFEIVSEYGFSVNWGGERFRH